MNGHDNIGKDREKCNYIKCIAGSNSILRLVVRGAIIALNYKGAIYVYR
jgi:hypothetical protein